MAATPLADAIEALHNALANYHPEQLVELREFFDDLPNFWEEAANSVHAFTDRMREEMPVNPAIPDHMQEETGVLAGLRDHSRELRPMFERLHKKELERIDNPRQHEEQWDLAQNQV